MSPVIERLRPRTSVLQHLPGIRRFYRYCLPLFPAAIEQFDLDQLRPGHQHEPLRREGGRQDRPRAPPLLLLYADALCLGPVRRVLRRGAGRDAEKPGLKPVLDALARWDAATAGRVDRYVAISQHVASRISRYYNRDAVVIYPPVDTGFLFTG